MNAPLEISKHGMMQFSGISKKRGFVVININDEGLKTSVLITKNDAQRIIDFLKPTKGTK